MSNVCLHRAMPLVSAPGSARWIVCPYHQWAYGRDGSLHTAPMMDGADGFDPTACRLPQLAVEEWNGFVFVSMGHDPPPLAPQLEPLAATLEQYGLADLVIADTIEFDSPWNWKLLVENFMEAYHHIGPHRETFQQSNPAAASFVADSSGGPWSLLHMPGSTDLDQSPDLPFLSGLDRERRAELLAACVYPTTLFAVSGTLGVWYEVVPHTHDRLTLRIHLLLEPHVAADPDVLARTSGHPRRTRLDPPGGHPGERRTLARSARSTHQAGPALALRSGDLAVQSLLAGTNRGPGSGDVGSLTDRSTGGPSRRR